MTSDSALVLLAESLDSVGAEEANNVVPLIAAIKECVNSQVGNVRHAAVFEDSLALVTRPP